MTDYETDLANLRDYAKNFGGYVYESNDGSCMWSSEVMTPEELKEHWEYTTQFNDTYEEYEDPDSDGYGWERRALARISI